MFDSSEHPRWNVIYGAVGLRDGAIVTVSERDEPPNYFVIIRHHFVLDSEPERAREEITAEGE